MVDMKNFYSPIMWCIWKQLLTLILKVRWKRAEYSTVEVKKMLDILKRASKLQSLNREDTLKIWNLTY